MIRALGWLPAQLWYFLPRKLGASDSSPLGLRFLIYKMGVMITCFKGVVLNPHDICKASIIVLAREATPSTLVPDPYCRPSCFHAPSFACPPLPFSSLPSPHQGKRQQAGCGRTTHVPGCSLADPRAHVTCCLRSSSPSLALRKLCGHLNPCLSLQHCYPIFCLQLSLSRGVGTGFQHCRHCGHSRSPGGTRPGMHTGTGSPHQSQS